MRAYLTAYLTELDALLDADAPDTDYDAVMRRHLHMIGFMQHERLIHFLVTMLFAIGFFLVMGFFLMTEQIMLVPLMLLILVLLVPYIMHYYFLENSVQKMYHQYDEINSRTARGAAAAEAGEAKGRE
ncbi:MAG: hypothetical protein K6E36_07585 [Oscillospiraceae bacterium]|nr:hypothetical protein [Oscillospiraceae bacterium]MCR5306340.1 hypothetical protein [Oscillospiraceae bacterium]